MRSIFSFLETRKKTVDLSPYMRRICDFSVPNRCHAIEQPRSENRYNRTLPVLLCPWDEGRPLAEQAMFAITKDISDRGVSVVTAGPIEGAFAVAFALPASEANEPWFFLGEAQVEPDWGRVLDRGNRAFRIRQRRLPA